MKFNNCSCILDYNDVQIDFKFGFVFYNALITSFELEGEFICSTKDSVLVAQLDILSAWKVTGMWNKSRTRYSHLTFKTEVICKFSLCMVLLLVSTNTALIINALYCWTKQMQQNPVT